MAMNPNPNPNANLPQDILIDIFSWLPAKSVGKCRCLSKPWRAQLSTPKFIKFHLTRQTLKENLILISPSHSLHTISTLRDDDETVSERVNLSNTWRAVVGSCNGLVLLLNQDKDLFLVNPITQEQVNIPELPEQESFSRTHGFGYDSFSDDYKIVTLSDFDVDGEEWFPETFVYVYSVKSGVWKRLDGGWPYCVPFKSGVYVNGGIYWIMPLREFGHPKSVIAAFDLADERFYEVPAPIGVVRSSLVFNKLVVLHGCLCMKSSSSSNVDGLWILKEDGEERYWVKFLMYFYYGEDIVKLLCFIGDDKVAVLDYGDNLLAFNYKEDDLTNKVVDGVSAKFTDGVIFTESLVSPSYGNEIEGNVLL